MPWLKLLVYLGISYIMAPFGAAAAIELLLLSRVLHHQVYPYIYYNRSL